LGGFFWTCGNCCTVPVIKCLGIGVGSLFWNIVGLIFGWAYARFGWFGITPEIPTKTWLNYLAIGLAILSTIVLVFVKTVENQVLLNKKEKKKGELVDVEELDIFDKSHLYFKQKFNINWFKHALGTFLSIFAGVCYALCYEPQLYVMNTVPGASQDNNDYAFSLSCGIMLSSLLFYIAYSIFYKVALKKTPQIYPEIILPCFVIGWLWGVANTAYFVSTNKLSQAISFPIANSGPSIVAFIIGLCYKEIKGFWNLTILFIGLALSIVSVILCGLSK
jgi:hypothetical protein